MGATPVGGGPEIRRLATDPAPADRDDRDTLRQHLVADQYSIPHVVGTCRMGPAPAGGDVGDARGRVHGVDRLGVVDASIIPERPPGFRHLIAVMLAEHLAPRIVEWP